MEWLETLVKAAEPFIVKPQERMEYEVAMAQARAAEYAAAAQLAAGQQQSQMMSTAFLILAVGGVGFLLFQAMK